MEQSITAVSAKYGISPRTLRYWSQFGLIESQRREDYAYRTYTQETMQRIGQILILRRLRFPPFGRPSTPSRTGLHWY